MTTPTLTRPGARFGTRAGRLFKARETGILIAFVAVAGIATGVNPTFLLSADGWRDLLLTPTLLVLLAVGEAMVIITRNVDLSVGSVVGLSTWICGQTYIAFPHTPIVVIFLIGIASGALMGLLNGVIVTYAKVPALVVTLGTLYIYRGITVLWAGSNLVVSSNLPPAFQDLGTSSILFIPKLAIIAAIVAIIAGWALRNLRAGREFYAIGSDPAAATLYGLRARRRVLTAFILSGSLAGMTGVLSLAYYASASSQTGSGYELQAVAAAVIGGVAIFGGSGTILGAVIGALLLTTINRALPVVSIPDNWQQAITGILIIAAIILDRVLLIRSTRKLTIAEDSTNV
ncbi:MAG TPA: ABC transporter permease [Galbitalea sp.]